MIKPFIYATCDRRYYDLYGEAFISSARAAGHEAEVFCDDGAETWEDKVQITFWRFQLMPLLLLKHPAALMLDIDAIIRGPIEIEPEYDMGLFLRPWMEHDSLRMLSSIFYCTDRAMGFAQAVADALVAARGWGEDQSIPFQVYEAMGSKFNVKVFDHETIDWVQESPAPICTAKGARKHEDWFMSEVAKWRHRKTVGAAA